MDVKPGQMFVWDPRFKDGWWFFEKVCDGRRKSFMGTDGHTHLHRGDIITIVSVHDAGPAFPPGADVPIIDENGRMTISPIVVPKAWHVALLHETLVWIEEDMLELHMKLIAQHSA